MEKEPENVYALKEKLLEAIRDSAPSKRFETISKRLEGNDELRERIDRFRERTYQVSNTEDPANMLDEMKILFEERRKVRENSLVAEYLSAELELCRMLQHICRDVMSVTDLQLDSFIDRIDA